jgi:hypothetical protein
MFESTGFKPAFLRIGPVVGVLREQVHYVAAESTNPLPPYTSWATAARNIQDPVDVASTAGVLVLVTNSNYAAGHSTWQEWRCQNCPTNALWALCLLSASPASPNVTVSWQSAAGVNYSLERCTNVGASAPFMPLATGIPGQSGTTSYTDTNAVGLAPLFYRVGVANGRGTFLLPG